MEYRKRINLNMDWETRLDSLDGGNLLKEEQKQWKTVQIPHNWEDYQGYRKESHGNLHGTAWYRKKLLLETGKADEHRFISFEGVSSYADVYLNGEKIGYHAGGLTGFTVDITNAQRNGENELKVYAAHPEKIKDLPWVCGGCFGTPNTEGSQPFGIFRPVSMYSTGAVRILPFGVWILPTGVKSGKVTVRIRTEVENLEEKEVSVVLCSRILDADGAEVECLSEEVVLQPGEKRTIEQVSGEFREPKFWSTDKPYLYYVESCVKTDGRVSDWVKNSFGLRFMEWENFPGTVEREIDAEKLKELPSESNHYFSRYTRGSEDSLVRIAPCGVRITLPECAETGTVIRLETSLENRDEKAHRVCMESFVQTYNATKSIANLKEIVTLEAGERKTIIQETERFSYLDMWTEENPFLHGVYTTVREEENPLMEHNQTYTSFGICPQDGLVNKGDAYLESGNADKGEKHRFLLNGEHVFINGTAEYQHLLGNDHAFDVEQIAARMKQIQAAGFNAFREAHCPHDLRYLEACEQMGILYWAQMGAHLYFDNQNFHNNFLKLTEEFVRERRNSPCVILWGIQNESLLPTYFGDEVRQLIRSLDDTASTERLVTTCNGGSGSDWNVPQNWLGTYGGNSLHYAEELKKQLMAGEYGQYRVLGKHEEGNPERRQNSGGDVSEELFAFCLENKVRLAEQIREYVYGHYQWIFSTHANPGRETVFCLDGSGRDTVGVVNSKGLLTCWGEPVDAYYMYRSNYVSPRKEPMVYIVSHTWPDRFGKVGEAADICVYSNCEEVELFVGFMDGAVSGMAEGIRQEIPKGLSDREDLPRGYSYGKKTRGKRGEHFVFENCEVSCNMLSAVGYVDGKPVAVDRILLENLPMAQGLEEWILAQPDILKPQDGEYLYRVNCGGGEYVDSHGNVWEGDCIGENLRYICHSWAEEYPELDADLGSVRTSSDLISGTRAQELFRSYRYGREKLEYVFPVENGNYAVELYFMEPWYGVGGGMDCTGWRLFDVAVNEVLISKVDIWKESGGVHTALKKTVEVEVMEGEIHIRFPRVYSYQAVISAIAICRKR